ncbi:MAG: peptidylprolyl isomerase [Gammaproteobacteria bacterium]|nr:peptidylprolyl isomerase [Gammaproteobacteria bacterium]
MVNDSEITEREYDEAVARHRERLKTQFGGKLPDSPAFDKQIKKLVIDQLVASRVLETNTVKSGYRISDDMLANRIKTMEPFLQDGKFMASTYEQLLRSQGLSVAEFEYLMRRDLLTQQLQQGVTRSTVLTRPTLNLVNSLQNQSRDISYLLIKQASYHESISVTDEEVEQYYNQNKDRYMHSEQVSIAYIELKADQLVNDIPVDEEAVRRAYDEYVATISDKEERKAKHILVKAGETASETEKADAKAKAVSLLAKLKNGESFEMLAKAESDDKGSASQGGDLGWVPRGMMVPAFEDALFKLKKNTVSEIVQTGFGFHIIRLEDIKAGQPESFESKQQELTNQVKQNTVDSLFYERSELMATLAYENDETLLPAAEALDIKVQHSGFFSQFNGTGIASHEPVRTAAFSSTVLKESRNSELLELGKNHIAVIRIDEHKKPKPKTLQEVRTAVIATLKSQKAREKAQAAGLQALADVQQLKSLSAFEKNKHYEFKNPGFIKRDNTETDRAILKAAFEMMKPVGNEAEFSSIDLSSGDVAVIQLSAVKQSTLSDEKDLSAIQQQIENEISQQEMMAVLSYLKSQSEIVVKEEL